MLSLNNVSATSQCMTISTKIRLMGCLCLLINVGLGFALKEIVNQYDSSQDDDMVNNHHEDSDKTEGLFVALLVCATSLVCCCAGGIAMSFFPKVISTKLGYEAGNQDLYVDLNGPSLDAAVSAATRP